MHVNVRRLAAALSLALALPPLPAAAQAPSPLLGFSAAGIWLWQGIDGFAIVSAVDPGALPNPLAKEVARQPGAWLANYTRQPLSVALPALAYAGTLIAMLLNRQRPDGGWDAPGVPPVGQSNQHTTALALALIAEFLAARRAS